MGDTAASGAECEAQAVEIREESKDASLAFLLLRRRGEVAGANARQIGGPSAGVPADCPGIKWPSWPIGRRADLSAMLADRSAGPIKMPSLASCLVIGRYQPRDAPSLLAFDVVLSPSNEATASEMLFRPRMSALDARHRGRQSADFLAFSSLASPDQNVRAPGLSADMGCRAKPRSAVPTSMPQHCGRNRPESPGFPPFLRPRQNWEPAFPLPSHFGRPTSGPGGGAEAPPAFHFAAAPTHSKPPRKPCLSAVLAPPEQPERRRSTSFRFARWPIRERTRERCPIVPPAECTGTAEITLKAAGFGHSRCAPGGGMPSSHLRPTCRQPPRRDKPPLACMFAGRHARPHHPVSD